MGRGSWPPLLAAMLVFLAVFAWQRQRSTFLALEADRDVAAALAARHGLTTADVQALRELAGSADAAPLVAAFAAERGELGEPLAAVALFGDRPAATAARRQAADPAAAWARFRSDPAAVPGLRFLAMRERFAARLAARD